MPSKKGLNIEKKNQFQYDPKGLMFFEKKGRNIKQYDNMMKFGITPTNSHRVL